MDTTAAENVRRALMMRDAGIHVEMPWEDVAQLLRLWDHAVDKRALPTYSNPGRRRFGHDGSWQEPKWRLGP